VIAVSVNGKELTGPFLSRVTSGVLVERGQSEVTGKNSFLLPELLGQIWNIV